ncbi:hypothetical protein CHRYSEOSP005_14950 [Chryseobacterium sp. Alg-005]|uniref:hypothetical protein n=1 Tax=Chryseobacterium sp. Alg-005 TaxID=3159516 RepID=UPI0035559273
MKTIYLFLLLAFSILFIGCSSDNDNSEEPKPNITAFVGKWSGKLYSDKFGSAYYGDWEFEVKADGSIINGKVIKEGQQTYTINGNIEVLNPGYSANLTGTFSGGSSSGNFRGTLNKTGSVAGTWGPGNEDDYWSGNKK